MQLWEVLGNGLTLILSGFLVFSGWIYSSIEAQFVYTPQSEVSPTITLENPHTEVTVQGKEERTVTAETTEQVEQSEEKSDVEEVIVEEVSIPDQIASALANISCTLKTPVYEKTASGSGVFIDEDGIILTNAHVAQFLLLENVDEKTKTECVVRTGNPATPAYKAKLLYISPSWIRVHAEQIDDPTPKGTGARDYALLYISETQPGARQAPFPALPFSTTEITEDSTSDAVVFVGGYPSLNPEYSKTFQTIEASPIHNLYGFTRQYVDMLSISSIGETGSGASGGPVVDQNGNLIGLITTRSSSGKLRAITLAYINRTITEETTLSLRETMTGNLAYRAALFNESLTPFLAETLREEL